MRDLLRLFVPDDERPTWPGLVCAYLRELKDEGWEWERAWSIATARHRPPGSWMHPAPGECSPYLFFQRACEAAYTDVRVPAVA